MKLKNQGSYKIVQYIRISFSFFASFAVFFGITSCSPVKERPFLDETKFKFEPICFNQLPFCTQLVPNQKILKASQENSFLLRFWDKNTGTKNGPYIDTGYLPFVKLWMRMKTGDHGSRRVRLEPLRDLAGNSVPGIFDLTQVWFTMRGVWEIQIKLKQNGNVVDEVIQNVLVR